MYGFLLTIMILDALLLIVVVLLQSGKGGGLAANFGGASSSSDSLMGSRQAGNLLTKMSWACGGVFLGLSLVLQLVGAKGSAPKSVLDKLGAPAATTAPVVPTGPAPASPLTAPSTAAPATTPPAGQSTPPASTPAKPPAKP